MTLTGTGGSSNPAGDVSINPSTLALDAQAGQVASGSIAIGNSGTANITVAEQVDSGGGVFTVSETCNAEITAGSSCTESVTANPPDQCTDASYVGSVTFSDDAGNQLGTTSLSSTAPGDSNQCAPPTDTPDTSSGGNHAAGPAHAPAAAPHRSTSTH